MVKINKPLTAAHRPVSRGTPLLVFVTVAGGAFLTYLIGQLAFLYQHPIHWGLGILGGIAGWLIGKLIYRLRGYRDII